jgi:hypothetical protein
MFYKPCEKSNRKGMVDYYEEFQFFYSQLPVFVTLSVSKAPNDLKKCHKADFWETFAFGHCHKESTSILRDYAITVPSCTSTRL